MFSSFCVAFCVLFQIYRDYGKIGIEVLLAGCQSMSHSYILYILYYYIIYIIILYCIIFSFSCPRPLSLSTAGVMDQLKIGGYFSDKVTKSCVFSTIHDAVLYCQPVRRTAEVILWSVNMWTTVYIYHKNTKSKQVACLSFIPIVLILFCLVFWSTGVHNH